MNTLNTNTGTTIADFIDDYGNKIFLIGHLTQEDAVTRINKIIAEQARPDQKLFDHHAVVNDNISKRRWAEIMHHQVWMTTDENGTRNIEWIRFSNELTQFDLGDGNYIEGYDTIKPKTGDENVVAVTVFEV